MAYHSITLMINGAQEHLDVPSNMTLLQLLRCRNLQVGTRSGAQHELGQIMLI